MVHKTIQSDGKVMPAAGSLRGYFIDWRRRWPVWVSYTAAAWSLIYGFLGLYWAFGGEGFPFGVNDPRVEAGEMTSLLAGVRPGQTAPIIASLGLIGALVALSMAQPWGRRIPRAVPLAFGWGLCIILILVIPDVRLLQNFAYAFALYFGLVDWQVWNQVLCMVGGLLWGATAVVYYRNTRDACVNCGRTAGIDRAIRVGIAAKWCKRFTWIAIIAALPYGVTRFAWNFGIPLGYTRVADLIEQFGQQKYAGIRFYSLPWPAWILCGLDFVGAILMHGLISRWGEIYPRWFPFVAGRRVHPLTAVIPAMGAATLFTTAGVGPWVRTVKSTANGSFDYQDFLVNWGAAGPGLLFFVWGVSLAAAAIAYYYRRRDRCLHCGGL